MRSGPIACYIILMQENYMTLEACSMARDWGGDREGFGFDYI